VDKVLHLTVEARGRNKCDRVEDLKIVWTNGVVIDEVSDVMHMHVKAGTLIHMHPYAQNTRGFRGSVIAAQLRELCHTEQLSRVSGIHFSSSRTGTRFS
jgi:hypothetical protein